jgi:hypothetical protein
MLGFSGVAAVQTSRYPEQGWVLLVFYVGTLALILSIIALLIKAAKDEEIDEDLTRLASIFLVILIASFSLAGGVQWLGRVSGIDGLVYQRAESYLDSQILHVTGTYAAILSAYETLMTISGITVKAEGGVSFVIEGKLGVSLNFGKPLKPITIIIEKLLSSVEAFVASIYLHKILLVFGHKYAMSTLFPVGVVLWVFPWTRKAGSLLIAVAITLWLVFPFTVILILEQTSKLVSQDERAFLSLPLNPLLESGMQEIRSQQENLTDKAWGLAKIIVGGALHPQISFVTSFLNAVFNWWAQMFVTWLLVPMINIIFLIFMIMNIADAIGGEAKPFARLAKFLLPK